MVQSESIKELSGKLLKIQAEIPALAKDKIAKTGKFSYKYLNIDTILDVIKPVLQKYNVLVFQYVETEEDRLKLHTEVVDTDTEQFINVSMEIVPQTNDRTSPMQALGSAITYAKRYQLSALLLINTDEDTDDIKISKINNNDEVIF